MVSPFQTPKVREGGLQSKAQAGAGLAPFFPGPGAGPSARAACAGVRSVLGPVEWNARGRGAWVLVG